MSADNSLVEPAMSTVAFGSTLAACGPTANNTASDLGPSIKYVTLQGGEGGSEKV